MTNEPTIRVAREDLTWVSGADGYVGQGEITITNRSAAYPAREELRRLAVEARTAGHDSVNVPVALVISATE